MLKPARPLHLRTLALALGATLAIGVVAATQSGRLGAIDIGTGLIPPPAATPAPWSGDMPRPAPPIAANGVDMGHAVAPAPAAAAVAVGSRSSAEMKATSPTIQKESGSPAAWDRMVVRNASLALQVENVEHAIAEVRAVAARGGGYVISSSSRLERSGDEERTIATLTIQVRTEAFDAAVQQLRQLGLKVESENGTSQDVTEEFVDLESGLRNLQATELAILKLVEKAQRIEDVLALQRELTQIRGQIERIQGRMKFLRGRSEMASIAVTLRQPPAADAPRVTPTGRAWDPLASAERGWQASLRILRGVADAVIVAAAFSWWMVPIVVIAGYVWRSRRTVAPSVEAG